MWLFMRDVHSDIPALKLNVKLAVSFCIVASEMTQTLTGPSISTDPPGPTGQLSCPRLPVAEGQVYGSLLIGC